MTNYLNYYSSNGNLRLLKRRATIFLSIIISTSSLSLASPPSGGHNVQHKIDMINREYTKGPKPVPKSNAVGYHPKTASTPIKTRPPTALPINEKSASEHQKDSDESHKHAQSLEEKAGLAEKAIESHRFKAINATTQMERDYHSEKIKERSDEHSDLTQRALKARKEGDASMNAAFRAREQEPKLKAKQAAAEHDKSKEVQEHLERKQLQDMLIESHKNDIKVKIFNGKDR